MSKLVLRSYTVVFLAAVILTACGKDDTTVRSTEGSTDLSLSIPLSKLAVSRIERAEIIISASGWAGITKALVVSGDSISGTVRQIPAGNSRKFVLNAYDSAGNLAYTGEAFADVIAGDLVEVNIKLTAVGPSGSTSAVPNVEVRTAATADRRVLSTYVTLEIGNLGLADATGVMLKCRARNSTGGAIGDASTDIGTLEANKSYLPWLEFRDADCCSSRDPRYIVKLDCTVEYNEGPAVEASVTVK
jgi:hypothetical protein